MLSDCDLRTYVLTRCLCSSETLSHNAVGMSEEGATPDSHRCGKGGETPECLKEEVFCAVLCLAN